MYLWAFDPVNLPGPVTNMMARSDYVAFARFIAKSIAEQISYLPASWQRLLVTGVPDISD